MQLFGTVRDGAVQLRKSVLACLPVAGPPAKTWARPSTHRVNVWAAARHVPVQSGWPARNAAEIPGPPWVRRAYLRAGFASAAVPADVPGAVPWPGPSPRKAASPAAADICSAAEAGLPAGRHDSLLTEWTEDAVQQRSSGAEMCCALSLAAVRHDSLPKHWQEGVQRYLCSVAEARCGPSQAAGRAAPLASAERSQAVAQAPADGQVDFPPVWPGELD